MSQVSKVLAGAVLLVAVLAAISVSGLNPLQKTVETEKLQNGAEIHVVENRLDGEERQVIEYSSGGEDYRTPFYSNLVPTLRQIKQNTPENATISAWWDYGHSIRGYTGRQVIAYSPSKWALENTAASDDWDTENRGRIEDREVIKDLAAVFVRSPEVSERLMRQYNSDYLFISRSDPSKLAIISEVYNREALSGFITALGCQRTSSGCSRIEGNGTDYVKYSRGQITMFVPVDERGRLAESEKSVVDSPRGRKDIDTCSEYDGDRACIAYNPFGDRYVYYSRNAQNSTMMQLLSQENTGSFRQVQATDQGLLFRLTDSN
jgi:hypothetical protein